MLITVISQTVKTKKYTSPHVHVSSYFKWNKVTFRGWEVHNYIDWSLWTLIIIIVLYPSITCGHLGCLHTLVIVNKTVMNIRLHVYFKLVFLFSLEENPEGG